MKPRGFTLIELMIVIAIIAIIAAIAIPNMIGASKAANERSASVGLRNFISIESTWRAADSDGNLNKDYWVADVAGFYYISPGSTLRAVITLDRGTTTYGTTSGTTGMNQNPKIGMGGLRMVDISIAEADGDPAVETATGYSTDHSSAPKSGYWYMSLEDYQTGPTTTTPYGIRNPEMFGFAAYPANYGSSGNHIFVVDQSGVVLQIDPGAASAVWTTAPTVGQVDPDGDAFSLYDTYPMNPKAAAGSVVGGPWGTMD